MSGHPLASSRPGASRTNLQGVNTWKPKFRRQAKSNDHVEPCLAVRVSRWQHTYINSDLTLQGSLHLIDGSTVQHCSTTVRTTSLQLPPAAPAE